MKKYVRYPDHQSRTAWWLIVAGLIAVGLLVAAVIMHQDGVFNDIRKHGSVDTPQEENQSSPTYAGAWVITKPSQNRAIEGYASPSSISPGSTILLHVSCRQRSSFTTRIYRMGWYQGKGAKLMANERAEPCKSKPIPKADFATGLVDPNWQASARVAIPKSWQPGVYLALLTNTDGFQAYAPMFVKSNTVASKYLFIRASATDAAYNAWGGNSLYKGYTPKLKMKRAAMVSLNRPYLVNNGAGNFLSWEYPMVKFLEKHNYRVDYASDIDIHENPSLLQKYKAIIITGHDEYWSRNMLNGYGEAVRKGVNLAIFAANTAFRPARFGADPFTQEPDSVVICYKDARADPYFWTKPEEDTAGSWRLFPLESPESKLTGELYKGEVTASAPLVVSDAHNWMFAKTGVKNGSAMPGLVGYEYDEYVPKAPQPKNVQVIFSSPVTDLSEHKIHMADATYYHLKNGGQVFNAGTIQWSWGLDPGLETYRPLLVKVTENILNRFN